MSSKIICAKANKIDKDAIVKFSSLLNEDDSAKTLDEIDKLVDKSLENGLMWVTKSGDKIIGYIMCELFDEAAPNFPNSIFISELYVAEAFRKQGVGRQLVKLVLSNKFPEKYTHFSITHDHEVRFLTDFYKSLGFEEVGVTDAGNIKLIRKI